MSFDLAVINVKDDTDEEEAQRIYYELCNGNYEVVSPSESIELFYQEITNLYPEIDDLPEEKIDSCPWSNAFDISDGAVLINITWSRVEEIAPLIITMATRYGLACYDPQASELHVPPTMPLN